MPSGTTDGNYRGYHGGPARFDQHGGDDDDGLEAVIPASHVKEPRLVLLTTLIPDLFTAKRILDIGCNDGAVTVQLSIKFNATKVCGVDIDRGLITKAIHHYCFQYSRIRPATADSPKVIDYFPPEAVEQNGLRLEADYQQYYDNFDDGEDADENDTHAISPRPNVFFFHEDWVTSNTTKTSGPFDVIIAFSVIKWLHLNHEDAGLRKFFKKCADGLVPGGHLVIELQPWESYEKAIKPGKAPHHKGRFQGLKIRPDAFPGVLNEYGFEKVVSSAEFPREIVVYRRI